MTLVSPFQGQIALMQTALNYQAGSNLTCHLFTNNHTVADADTLASYTESSAAGYSQITLTGTSWTISNISGTVTATYPAVTFSYSAGETAYGYYILQDVIPVISENFSSSFVIPSGGGAIVVGPRITSADHC
jgi:hypothetical protein